MVGVAALLGYSQELQIAVGLAAIALAIDCVAQVIGAIFNGLQRMELGAAIIFVQELAFLVGGILVLALGLPFLWLFGVFIPARFVGVLLAFWLYRRVLGQSACGCVGNGRFYATSSPHLPPTPPTWRWVPFICASTCSCCPLFRAALLWDCTKQPPPFFYRFNILARMFNNALMPLMASEFEKESVRVRTYANAAMKYQMAMGMPLTVLCIMLGTQFMVLIYGSEFAASGLVFSLLATIITLRFLDNTLATTLTAVNMQTQRSLIVAFVAVVNVGLNVVVLPRYSYVGAAATTIVTEVAFCAALYLVLSRKIRQPLQWRVVIRPFLAAFAMAMSISFMSSLATAIHYCRIRHCLSDGSHITRNLYASRMAFLVQPVSVKPHQTITPQIKNFRSHKICTRREVTCPQNTIAGFLHWVSMAPPLI